MDVDIVLLGALSRLLNTGFGILEKWHSRYFLTRLGAR